MSYEFRADVSIRVRGQTPMDWKEFKSEHYDSIDDFAAAIAEMVVVNIDDYIDGEDGDYDD